MKKILFLIMIFAVFHINIFSEIHLGILGAVNSQSKKLHNKTENTIIYPDTEDAPILTIKWWSTINSTQKSDPLKYPVPIDEVLENGMSTFGMKKGGSPGYSDQMTLWVASSAWKPIYALADGVVITLHKGYDQDHQVVKYGKNWAILYCHFAELSPDLYIGKIVKKGDYIGRIVPMNPSQGGVLPKSGYFEYRLLRKNSEGNWIAVNPYNYLDDVSKENIKQIWLKKRNKTWGNYDYFGNLITEDNIHNKDLKEIDRGSSYNFNSNFLYDYWPWEDYKPGYYEPPDE